MLDLTMHASKTAHQQTAALKWRNNGGVGGWKWPTGMGKTYAAEHFIIKPMRVKNPAAKIIVVVPTTNLKAAWKAKVEALDVEVYTGSDILDKKVVHQCSLLIIDEFSSFYGPEMRKVFEQYILYTYILWLDATPEDKSGRHKELIEKMPIVDEVSEKLAIQNGWIAGYKVYNIGIDMTEQTRQLYDEYSAAIGKYLGYFGDDLEKAKKVLHGFADREGRTWNGFQTAMAWAHMNGWSQEIQDIADSGDPRNPNYEAAMHINNMWNPHVIIGYARQLFESIRHRTFLLYKSQEKVDAAIKIVHKRAGIKTIAFSQSTEFASKLYDLVNTAYPDSAVVYHSNIPSQPMRAGENNLPSFIGKGDYIRIKTKSAYNYGQPKVFGAKSLKDAALRDFATPECWFISAAAALDKGFDEKTIKLAIINSQTSNPTQFAQRKGRATRIDEKAPDTQVEIVVLYFKDTVEYSWLMKAQGRFAIVTWLDNVDQFDNAINDDVDV